MAHFLIYIPQEHVAVAQKRDLTMSPLAYVGLPDFAAGAFHLQTADGPDGKGGTLFSWAAGTAQHRMHFNASEQDWIPAVPDPLTEAAAQRYWLGFWLDSPSTARDLQRPRTVPGNEIPIGDTGSWIIPDPQQLPCTVGVNSAGAWVPQVDDRYAEYDSAIKTLRNTVVTGEGELENDRLFNFCLSALEINYRITREVVSRLKMFTTETTVDIARLAIGLPASVEV